MRTAFGKNSVSALERAQRGVMAEDLAAQHLQANGLAVLRRNYRCKGGEIDLIARDRATLVFVEVRLRSSEQFGGAGGSIDWRKQARIVRAAGHFLLTARPSPCRFDVVLIGPSGLDWIRDAFQV